jgi:MFS family permease
VAFSVAVGFGLVAPVITRFAKSFGVGRAAAGLVLSVFALMRLVSALGCGRLVNRYGERLVLALGIGIVGVSSALAGASQSYVQLLVLRGAGGVGSAMFSVSAMSLVLRSTTPDQRGRAVGLFSGSFLLGGIGGPAVGSTVAHLGFRAPFYIYAGTLLVAGSIGLALLPRTPLADPPPVPGAVTGTTLREAFRSRAYRAALAANLTDSWAALGVRSALIPLFVVEVLGLPDSWTYIGFFVVAGVNGAVLYPAGRWADDRGRRPVLLGGLVLSAAAMTLLATTHTTFAYIVAMAVFGLGSGLLDVAPAAVVGDVVGGRSGTTVAAYQMSGDAGSVVGPVAAGALADRVSYGAAFGLTAGVLGLAAVMAYAAPETRVPRAEAPSG